MPTGPKGEKRLGHRKYAPRASHSPPGRNSKIVDDKFFGFPRRSQSATPECPHERQLVRAAC